LHLASNPVLLLPLCCASQTVEQAAAEAERLEEEARKKREAQARAAQAQAERLGAGGALQLEGHPQPACNGLYRRVGQELHGGFPRYEHASGRMQLYRYQAEEEWRVNTEFTPDKHVCVGYIRSAGGEVPVRAQAWQSYEKVGPSPWPWKDYTITVRELVRAVAPLRLVLCCCSLYADSIRRWSSFVWR